MGRRRKKERRRRKKERRSRRRGHARGGERRRLQTLREEARIAEATLAEATLEAEWVRLCAADGRVERAANERKRETREGDYAHDSEECESRSGMEWCKGQSLVSISPFSGDWTTTTPLVGRYGRGDVALAADVVAGPPAVVATAREVNVIDGPCPLRERRRGAGGRRRRRPSCHRRRRRP